MRMGDESADHQILIPVPAGKYKEKKNSHTLHLDQQINDYQVSRYTRTWEFGLEGGPNPLRIEFRVVKRATAFLTMDNFLVPGYIKKIWGIQVLKSVRYFNIKCNLQIRKEERIKTLLISTHKWDSSWIYLLILYLLRPWRAKIYDPNEPIRKKTTNIINISDSIYPSLSGEIWRIKGKKRRILLARCDKK